MIKKLKFFEWSFDRDYYLLDKMKLYNFINHLNGINPPSWIVLIN
jgi:hypothetical protein